jgi:hypothetical protein
VAVPVVYGSVVLGMLAVWREGGGVGAGEESGEGEWTVKERMQLDRIARSLALALALDQVCARPYVYRRSSLPGLCTAYKVARDSNPGMSGEALYQVCARLYGALYKVAGRTCIPSHAHLGAHGARDWCARLGIGAHG